MPCDEWARVYTTFNFVLLAVSSACQNLPRFSKHLRPLTWNAFIYLDIRFSLTAARSLCSVCITDMQLEACCRGQSVRGDGYQGLTVCGAFAGPRRSVKCKLINQPWHYRWWDYWFQLFREAPGVLVTWACGVIGYGYVSRGRRWPRREKTKMTGENENPKSKSAALVFRATGVRASKIGIAIPLRSINPSRWWKPTTRAFRKIRCRSASILFRLGLNQKRKAGVHVIGPAGRQMQLFRGQLRGSRRSRAHVSAFIRCDGRNDLNSPTICPHMSTVYFILFSGRTDIKGSMQSHLRIKTTSFNIAPCD